MGAVFLHYYYAEPCENVKLWNSYEDSNSEFSMVIAAINVGSTISELSV